MVALITVAELNGSIDHKFKNQKQYKLKCTKTAENPLIKMNFWSRFCGYAKY